MEFCSGGDLHTLRQRQPGKHFSELAARWVTTSYFAFLLTACLSHLGTSKMMRFPWARKI
jgi:hypothetical protein